MKIAICLSGQPRGIPLSIEQTLDNLVTPLNADVFIHSWYSKECDNKPFDSAQPAQDSKVGRWKPDSDKIIIESLNPKKYLFEPPNSFSEFQSFPGVATAIQPKIASIFYGIYKSNELKKKYEIENGFEYDIVIRTRLDLLYKNKLSLDLISSFNYDNTLWAPKFYQDHRQNDSYPIKSGGHYSSMTDIFLISNSKTMDKICNVFPHFGEIHEEIYPFPYGEAFIGYNARHKYNINVKTFDYYMDIMHRVVNVNTL